MYDPAQARFRTVKPMGGNLKPDLTLKTCLVFQVFGIFVRKIEHESNGKRWNYKENFYLPLS